MRTEVEVTCPTCLNDWRRDDKDKCKTCKGTGHVTRRAQVGDGATIQIGSDRYAATVIWVSPSGHQIKLQRDKTKATTPIAYSESQSYICVADPNGEIEKAQVRLNREGKPHFCICGKGYLYVTLGVKSPYRDPSF